MYPESKAFKSTRPSESGDPAQNSTGHGNSGSALEECGLNRLRKETLSAKSSNRQAGVSASAVSTRPSLENQSARRKPRSPIGERQGLRAQAGAGWPMPPISRHEQLASADMHSGQTKSPLI
jgi:hypothetical protein